jgi:hypothetical protein
LPWQELIAGLIVFAAAAYVVWRFRGSNSERKGPDVPVSKLTRKRPKSGSCDH